MVMPWTNIQRATRSLSARAAVGVAGTFIFAIGSPAGAATGWSGPFVTSAARCPAWPVARLRRRASDTRPFAPLPPRRRGRKRAYYDKLVGKIHVEEAKLVAHLGSIVYDLNRRLRGPQSRKKRLWKYGSSWVRTAVVKLPLMRKPLLNA
jgi:hypothetical protein